MNSSTYIADVNIKRYQNLLDTSVDETEREVLKTLLAEEKAKADSQAASKSNKS